MPRQINYRYSDTVKNVPLDVQKVRLNLGLCPTCGIQIQTIDQFGKVSALTNCNVFESRCMLCNPWPKQQETSHLYNAQKRRYSTSTCESTKNTSSCESTKNCHKFPYTNHEEERLHYHRRHSSSNVLNNPEVDRDEQLKWMHSSMTIGKSERSFGYDTYSEQSHIIHPSSNSQKLQTKYNQTFDFGDYEHTRVDMLRMDSLELIQNKQRMLSSHTGIPETIFLLHS